MTSRYVPHLRFEEDLKLHKTLETLRLIEQAREEWEGEPEPSREDSESFDQEDSEDEKTVKTTAAKSRNSFVP